MKKTFTYQLATVGALGYLPASGTVGTVLALPFACAARFYCSFYNYIMLTTCIVMGIYYLLTLVLANIKTDPSEIIVDEIAGCFIMLCTYNVTIVSLFLSMLLFRFFDVSKTCGIRYCESMTGAIGVLLDDVIAAFFAVIIVNILLHINVL